MIKLIDLILELKTDYEKLLDLLQANKDAHNNYMANLRSMINKGIKLNRDVEFKRDKMIDDTYDKLKKDLISKSDDPYAQKGNLNAKYIYHYTTGWSLYHIIQNDVMEGNFDGIISFTTNRNLYSQYFVFRYDDEDGYGGRNKYNIGIKIKFDLKKMLNDKIKFRQGSNKSGTHNGEQELYIKTHGRLYNIVKYIVDVIIILNKENMQKNKVNLELLEKLLKSKNIKYKIV